MCRRRRFAISCTATRGIPPGAIAQRLLDAQTFDQGILDLYRTASRDGVFFYTFFKGTATLD